MKNKRDKTVATTTTTTTTKTTTTTTKTTQEILIQEILHDVITNSKSLESSLYITPKKQISKTPPKR